MDTTTRKPASINTALIAITKRAQQTTRTADAVVTYTTADRSPLTGECRVIVRERTGTGFNAAAKRTLWSGPVAVGVDAAGVAAWEQYCGAVSL